MTYQAAIVISAIVLAATAVVLTAMFAARKRAAEDDELKQQASMRGWRFEATPQRGYRIRRWSGSRDGIDWIAESIERPGGQNRRPIRHARWRTTASRGPAAPIVFLGVPIGKETPRFKIAQGDSVFAQIAQKVAGFAFDKAVDSHFGEEIGRDVDAAALKPLPNPVLPGFIVMAIDPEAAARLLFQGLSNALTAATADPQSVFGTDDRPWLLLWKDGVSLARNGRFAAANDVEAFVEAGVALARLPLA